MARRIWSAKGKEKVKRLQCPDCQQWHLPSEFCRCQLPQFGDPQTPEEMAAACARARALASKGVLPSKEGYRRRLPSMEEQATRREAQRRKGWYD